MGLRSGATIIKIKFLQLQIKFRNNEDSALGLPSRLDLSSGRKSAIGANLPEINNSTCGVAPFFCSSVESM